MTAGAAGVGWRAEGLLARAKRARAAAEPAMDRPGRWKGLGGDRAALPAPLPAAGQRPGGAPAGGGPPRRRMRNFEKWSRRPSERSFGAVGPPEHNFEPGCATPVLPNPYESETGEPNTHQPTRKELALRLRLRLLDLPILV